MEIKYSYVLNRKTLMFAAVTIVAAVTGCSKFRDEARPDNDILDDGKPVKIEFATNVVNVRTKASITGLNENHDLYIYGLNRSKPGVGEINNARAHMAAPAGAQEGWSLTDGMLSFADGKTFFYNGTRDRYEFFGYHVADAATVPETLTGYQLDVTIDGTQDILLASADPAVDITAPTVDTDEVTSVEDVYSAWSTRRGVVPKLVFKHALVQYKFEVKNSGMQPVVLQSIEVTSKTNGVLTAVNQDPTSEGADNGLVQGLKIKPNDSESKLKLESSTFTTGGALLDPKGEGPEDDVMVDGVRLEKRQDAPVEIEGEIMTFAGQNNKVVLKLVQSGMKEGDYRQITLPITLDETLNHGTVTQPGYSYLVSIVVYSLEKVDMEISLIPWQKGGTIILDQETEAGKPDTGYEDEIYNGNTEVVNP